MCYIWKNPTDPDYEIDLKTLEKLPSGFDHLNVTGGEPTLRNDLGEICDLLYPKTKKLEINSNGLHIDRLLPIVKKYPDMKIRLSVEGFENTNDSIRGEKGGYAKKVEGMNKLIEAGGCDLGFATTFQDENIDEIIDMFKFTQKLNIELATSALHNGFQFHKNDNYIYNRLKIGKKIEGLITEMLKTWNLKNWFRAYLNLGLIAKVLGHDRLIPCTAGSDFIFLDPWGDVYACNVRNDLLMGNLHKQTWHEIVNSPVAKEMLGKVSACTQNCWMVASAKTAMRNKYYAKIPKVGVLRWVVYNKIKTQLGLPIDFEKYIDYSIVHRDAEVIKRQSYLSNLEKKTLQPAESRHYTQFDRFFNR